MAKKNLIYFGSPEFSSQILESILGLSHVVAVVTSPDRPLDRKQILTPSPVALTAGKFDLPIFKPEKLDDANLAHLKLLKPDISLVVSYKKIIPPSWLTTPTLGTFNLHFSLLPKYRGALCISEAIRNQDQQTGVTLMLMDAGLDTGPIISQAKITIDIDDNVKSLTNKLTQTGLKLLSEYLPLISSGKLASYPQDNSKATLTPTTKTRNRDSAFIGWSEVKKAIAGENAAATHALIRSTNPDPGAWTKVDDIDLKLIQTHLTPGNKLEIEIVQIPGKTPITWKNFTSGHPPT